MSIFKSASTFITRTFDTATSSVDSIDKVLDIANIYVENQHKSYSRTIKSDAMLSTAQSQREVQKELDADPDLQEIYTKLEADW
jgi:hypothetical protein